MRHVLVFADPTGKLCVLDAIIKNVAQSLIGVYAPNDLLCFGESSRTDNITTGSFSEGLECRP